MTPEQILMQRIGALTFEVAQLTAERDRLAAENVQLRAQADEGDGPETAPEAEQG